MADTETNDDIAAMSFEAALKELEEIVRSLEQGQGALDDAISAYERGSALKRHCEARLKEARERVEKISLAADGSVSAQTTDIA